MLKYLTILFFYLIIYTQFTKDLYCQIGSIIPKERRVDWQYAGYMHNGIPIPTAYDFEVTVEGFNNSAIGK